ncbi:MAG: hypothetical protein QM733_08320 [Ilumatobacteraceae bacterium]
MTLAVDAVRGAAAHFERWVGFRRRIGRPFPDTAGLLAIASGVLERIEVNRPLVQPSD